MGFLFYNELLFSQVPLDALFYDVYTQVSDLHLAEVGIDVEWTDVNVFGGNENIW